MNFSGCVEHVILWNAYYCELFSSTVRVTLRFIVLLTVQTYLYNFAVSLYRTHLHIRIISRLHVKSYH